MHNVLRDVITFSTILMMKHESKEYAASRNEHVNYENCDIPLSQIDDELVEQMLDDFLESVFGTESKLTRIMFLKKLASEENRWILDSEEVRRRVKRHLRA